MGYRGKVAERERARELRAQAWTYNEIVAELGVARSSVSLWVRDVEFDEAARAARAGHNRRYGAQHRGPKKLARAKQAEIAHFLAEGRERVGLLSERDLFIAGIALHAGEGAKNDGAAAFANSDPEMIALFCRWLRRFLEIDESRLRLSVYLHQGLDLEAAEEFWSVVAGVPRTQFNKAYRAVPDPSIRKSKHPMGCARVSYSSSAVHRAIMGMVRALLSCSDSVRGSSTGGAGDC